MRVYLIRHGRTEYNERRLYQGQRDIPLSPEGEAELASSALRPETVYVSPLIRARRTAELLFPGARQVAVAGLREMDFGVFEGRSFADMANDPDYRAWVDGGCEGRCPGGESRAEFCERTCAAFSEILARAAGESELFIVAHGGTLMAIMERCVRPQIPYFSLQPSCGCGYVLEKDGEHFRLGAELSFLA